MTPLVLSIPMPQLRELLGDLPEVEVIEWDLSGPAPAPVIDIVLPPYLGGAASLERLEGVRVRLVQSLSLGYDGVEAHLPRGMVFANAVSVHETSTSELTLALILAAQRGLPDFVRAADQGRWAPGWHPSLADHTVLLVGYGGVGRAIDARLAPFEVTVERVARTARTQGGVVVHDMSSLPQLLAAADIVVIAVPLDDSTTHLVDDRFLSQMRDGALLVNVARGRVADTEALLAHAKSGRLRLALDVVDPEPLPQDHPLFALPNVLISPHVGGATSAALPRMARLVREQIERMQRGEEPINVVLRT